MNIPVDVQVIDNDIDLNIYKTFFIGYKKLDLSV